MIVGITGGMGCGKTAAAHEFEKHGFRRLDTDGLVRERVLPADFTRAAVRERFGASVFTAAGEVDRAALGARVFASDVDLRWLESLVHPQVFALWREAIAQEPDGLWAVDVPLLFEGGLEIWFDFTVCVACAPENQLARLERRGMSRAVAGQRISKQLPLARKIELADFVLWNDGSLEFLQDQVRRLIALFKP